MPCLLLLLLPPLRVSADTTEPCELDDDDFRCVCNFTDRSLTGLAPFSVWLPSRWRSVAAATALDQFLKGVNTDPKQYADTIKALRVRRLKLGTSHRFLLNFLVAVLRALRYSRLKELTLEDLEVTGPTPRRLWKPLGLRSPPSVSVTCRGQPRGAWLGELQQWLKPGLRAHEHCPKHTRLPFRAQGSPPSEALTPGACLTIPVSATAG